MKFVTYFFLLLPVISNAQYIVRGLIVNKSTNEPLPYASIRLKNSPSIGTISNQDGEFQLNLAQRPLDSLIVSFVGFNSKYQRLDGSTKSLIIELTEDRTLLSEIVVMPIDTLHSLLKKAFEQIPQNYPSTPTLIRGLYRETNLLLPEEQFLYYSEAIIDYENPGYQTTHYGAVRINEGGKLESPNRSDISHIYFYAGPYLPQRYDFVKSRIEFVNPRQFERYQFSFYRKVRRDNGTTYVIDFLPKEKALYEGRLFLDSASLGYIGAEFKLTKAGLLKDNVINSNEFIYSSRSFNVKYELDSTQWKLYFVSQDGVGYNKKKDRKIRYTNEFLTLRRSSYNKNIAITESETFPYHAIYTLEDDKFDDKFLAEPERMARINQVDSVLRLFNDTDSIKIEQPNKVSVQKRNNRYKLIKFATRISSSLSISFLPINLKHNGVWSVDHPSFHIDKTINDRSQKYFPLLGADLKYYPTNSLAISLRSYFSLNDNISSNALSVGVEVSRRLFGHKKPLFLQPSLNYFWNTNRINLGETNSTEPFVMNNKTIDSDQIRVGIGELSQGILLATELIYKFHSRLAISSRISYVLLQNQESNLYVDELNGFFLTRKKSNEHMNSEHFTILKDNVNQTESPIQLNKNRLWLEFCLRIGFLK